MVVQIQIDLQQVPVHLEQDTESGEWIAHNDELRVMAVGRDAMDAAQHFYEALEALIRQEIEAGRQIPEPLVRYQTVPA